MAEVLHGYVELRRRLGAISSPEVAEAMMKRVGDATVREAKILVRRKTGNLGRSIHVSSLSKNKVTVEAGAHYGIFLELGTRPHEIRPRLKKVLAWPATAGGARLSGNPTKAAQRGAAGGGGARGGLRQVRGWGQGATPFAQGGARSGPIIFSRGVHHPGTAPMPFLVPGARLAIQRSGFLDLVVERWNQAA